MSNRKPDEYAEGIPIPLPLSITRRLTLPDLLYVLELIRREASRRPHPCESRMPTDDDAQRRRDQREGALMRHNRLHVVDDEDRLDIDVDMDHDEGYFAVDSETLALANEIMRRLRREIGMATEQLQALERRVRQLEAALKKRSAA